MGLEFQEEFSDMLLLNMLRSATKASGDKDRVGISFLLLMPEAFYMMCSQHLQKMSKVVK